MKRRTWAVLALGAGLAWSSPPTLAVEEDSLLEIRKDFQKYSQRAGGSIGNATLLDLCDRAFAIAVDDVEQKAPALMLVVQYTSDSADEKLHETAVEAIEMLIESYVDEPVIVDLVMRLGQDQGPHAAAYGEFLDQIAKESANERIRASVGYARLQPLLDKFRYGGGLTEEEEKKLLTELKKVAPKLGELSTSYGLKLGPAAEGALFELSHLQIGCVAPDIEAEDIDGVKFKLSDYRGKVVMLDFWGDW